MNRNDVGKNIINVNLFIKTEIIVGVGEIATAGASVRKRHWFAAIIKTEKHRCIYLSIDGHGCYQTQPNQAYFKAACNHQQNNPKLQARWLLSELNRREYDMLFSQCFFLFKPEVIFTLEW